MISEGDTETKIQILHFQSFFGIQISASNTYAFSTNVLGAKYIEIPLLLFFHKGFEPERRASTSSWNIFKDVTFIYQAMGRSRRVFKEDNHVLEE